VDTLVIIPNDRLLQLVDPKMGVDAAFKLADQCLHNGVQAIAEVVTVPGLVNLDFADIRTVMKDAGPAWMSIGKGSGANRAADAAKAALSSPLLEISIERATGVLFNVTGGSNLSLFEVSAAAEVIQKAVAPDANIIFGVVLNPALGNDVMLTLIATGFAVEKKLDLAKWEKEIGQLLKGNVAKLDVPSFLRNQNYDRGGQSRPTVPPQKKAR
jgi:cell division protein FtsZ